MIVVEMINSLSHRGGAEVLFFNLVKELSKNKNIQVNVILLYNLVDDSFKSIYSLDNVKVFCVNKKSSFDFKCAKRLKQILNDISPDIVNIHLSGLITYYLAFKTKKQKWELIKTFHSVPGKDLTKIDLHLEKKFVKKQNIHFIAISDLIKKDIQNLYGVEDVVVICNGIKLPSTINKKKPLYDFIIVATMSEVKNHKFLFNTFKKYLKENPGAKLMCVGDGPLFNENKQYVKEHLLEQNILFYGQSDNPTDLLLKSNAFVLASTREGFPMSILEAMSLGLPIIAPRVGGIPDVVKEGINGFLFNVNDSIGMLNCFNKIKEPNIIKSVNNNNIEEAKKYSIESCASKYIAYFESVLGK